MLSDLTPMDFTFLNCLNNKVVGCQPKTIDEFEAFINIEINSIPPDIIISMCQGVNERFQKCIMNKGSRFE